MWKLNKGGLKKVDEIEYRLSSSLKPLSPRPDYITNLHGRLTDTSRLHVTFDRNSPFRYLLFGIVSVVSFLLIFVTTIRIFLSILGILGLVRYVKRQKTREELMPSQSNPVL